MRMKVKCKKCDWEGQAIIGKCDFITGMKGYKRNEYKCPKCGGDLIRGKGRYDFDSEFAITKTELM